MVIHIQRLLLLTYYVTFCLFEMCRHWRYYIQDRKFQEVSCFCGDAGIGYNTGTWFMV